MGKAEDMIRYLNGMIRRADTWEHARISISRVKAEHILKLLKQKEVNNGTK